MISVTEALVVPLSSAPTHIPLTRSASPMTPPSAETPPSTAAPPARRTASSRRLEEVRIAARYPANPSRKAARNDARSRRVRGSVGEADGDAAALLGVALGADVTGPRLDLLARGEVVEAGQAVSGEQRVPDDGERDLAALL